MSARPTIHNALSRVHSRVTLLATSLSAICILLVGYLAARDYAQQELRLTAQAASYTVEAALVFEDRTAIAEAVRAFTDNEEIGELIVRGPDGRELFAWRQGADAGHFPGEGLLRSLAMLSPEERHVVHEGRAVGDVRIVGSAEGLTHFLGRGLAGIIACLLIIAVVAYLLARRLQRSVAEPLVAMARIAHEVRKERAFSRRVPGAEIAEINSLGEDFNALLEEVQNWQETVASEHESLAYRAMHDGLTGLANRAFFEGQIIRAVEDAVASGGTLGLLYMDGDDFKRTNDCHGHGAGDALLVELAARIRACAGRDDLVSRLGGDEFVVLLTGDGAAARTPHLAASIRVAMGPDFALPDGTLVQPAMSIGTSTFPADGHDAAALIHHADIGMYEEKQRRAPRDTQE